MENKSQGSCLPSGLRAACQQMLGEPDRSNAPSHLVMPGNGTLSSLYGNSITECKITLQRDGLKPSFSSKDHLPILRSKGSVFLHAGEKISLAIDANTIMDLSHTYLPSKGRTKTQTKLNCKNCTSNSCLSQRAQFVYIATLMELITCAHNHMIFLLK